MTKSLLSAIFGLSLVIETHCTIYYGSRRIYTKQSSTALCENYIETEFWFDDNSTELEITITSSTDTAWFAIGFPDETHYYDRSSSSDVMDGYAIIVMNDAISEYDIIPNGDCTINDCYSLQSSQDITDSNITTQSGKIVVEFTRELNTSDSNDFQFDLDSYLDCYPFLMTVAIGQNMSFTSTHSYGSSYIYLYDESILSDTSTWSAEYNNVFDNFAFNVTMDMDPITELVTMKIVDEVLRWWGVSWLDIADTAYYASDPIVMESDYSHLWIDDPGSSGSETDMNVTEAFLKNSTDCLADVNTPSSCFEDVLQQISDYNFTFATNYYFEYKMPFQSCGYEFNPYEFKTCRPITMVSVVAWAQLTFYDVAAAPTYHTYSSTQIDSFPTRSPTGTPTAAPSLSPSNAPSGSPSQPPSLAPSSAPTSSFPTLSPTDETVAPTLAPSAAPTGKPTNLPTVSSMLFDTPDCPGLIVLYLSEIFPEMQSGSYFNELTNDSYNQRRIWTNGFLDIYYTFRFEDGGDWVITNTSYSMISITSANANATLPGIGYVYYDHFPHDNIVQVPDQEITLYFECENASFPTIEPTSAPTTASPTIDPTTIAPTSAPTANCSALCLYLTADGCSTTIGEDFEGCYVKSDNLFDGRAKWGGVDDVLNYDLYYSDFHDYWVIDGDNEYSALTEGSGVYPPQNGQWSVFEQANPFTVDCEVNFTYTCYATGLPTKAPTPSPTTGQPTTPDPTTAPSKIPTLAPSAAPSLAPSLAPSIAPTASPIAQCKGLNVTGTDHMDGMYRRQSGNDSLIADRYWWLSLNGDYRIFWSDSVLHETWIIYSANYGRYWKAQTKPDAQPPLDSDWDLYIGASPFVSSTSGIDLLCLATLPPTRAPTPAPTLAPSSAPSMPPTGSPSQPPTLAPSQAPSLAPTAAPSTLSPTSEPTSSPTSEPTAEPTAEACDYMILTSDDPMAIDIGEWIGEYAYNSTNMRWELGSGYIKRISLVWTITSITNMGSLFCSDGSGSSERPPFSSSAWQFNDSSSLTDRNYSIDIDCSTSSAPSFHPTQSPTLAPTTAPTSSCYGLFFDNLDAPEFAFSGWFVRQDSFLINSHKWWISIDNLARIEYVSGQWWLFEADNDLFDDEDPVMTTDNGHGMLSPPSGTWYYARTIVGSGSGSQSANISITCSHSYSPTLEPTLSPSTGPTDYSDYNWSYCPDDSPYFVLIDLDDLDESSNYSVYWPEPIVNSYSHLYSINVTTPTFSYQNGDQVPFGMHDISYISTDEYGSIDNCTVTLYVIGAMYNGYSYCKSAKFHVFLFYNLTDYVQLANGDSDESSDDSDEYVQGKVYDSELIDDEQNCYITSVGKTFYLAQTVSDGTTSTFLGIETENLVWEILILILCIILLCLCLECLIRACVDYKRKRDSLGEKEEMLANKSQSEMVSKTNDIVFENDAIELQQIRPPNGSNTEVNRQMSTADSDVRMMEDQWKDQPRSSEHIANMSVPIEMNQEEMDNSPLISDDDDDHDN